MKTTIILFLLIGHSLTWADNSDVSELARSLANYQACSKVSITINDEQMFNYYQSMFNDTSLGLLKLDTKQAREVYLIWGKSEKILVNIGLQNLQKVCLSRFDELSRELFDK